jgi:hypothetical protein
LPVIRASLRALLEEGAFGGATAIGVHSTGVRTLLVSLFAAAVLLGCSSSPGCPSPAPGGGDPCSGNVTCTYGSVSCSCKEGAWLCLLPYSPQISTSGGGDDGGG